MEKPMMKPQDLKNTYSDEDLSNFPGDGALRFRIFSPFLEDISGREIVYYERFVCIAAIHDVKITAKRFLATASLLLHIEQEGRPLFPPRRPWKFGANWEHMVLSGGHFHVNYSGWSIWPEAALVKTVETHAVNGRFREALSLSLYEEYE
jgi:hypothetical protein